MRMTRQWQYGRNKAISEEMKRGPVMGPLGYARRECGLVGIGGFDPLASVRTNQIRIFPIDLDPHDPPAIVKAGSC